MSQRAIAYVQTIAPLLTESEACVALAIAVLADDETDVAEVTLAQIGAQADRKERCVRYCLRALEGHGILVRDYQPYGYVIAKTFYHFVELKPARLPTRPSDNRVRQIADAARRRDEAIRARNVKLRNRVVNWRKYAHGCDEQVPRKPQARNGTETES